MAPVACRLTPVHENGTRTGGTPSGAGRSSSSGPPSARARGTPRRAGPGADQTGRRPRAARRRAAPRRRCRGRSARRRAARGTRGRTRCPRWPGPRTAGRREPAPRSGGQAAVPSCSAAAGVLAAVSFSIGQASSPAPGRSAALARVPLAWRIQSAGLSSSAGRRGARVQGQGPPALVAGEPTVSWTATDPRSGKTSGTSRVSSSTRSQPTSSPARRAISSMAVPGTSTAPPTTWSASQRCVRADSRPVSSVSPVPGTLVAAPSSG